MANPPSYRPPDENNWPKTCPFSNSECVFFENTGAHSRDSRHFVTQHWRTPREPYPFKDDRYVKGRRP